MSNSHITLVGVDPVKQCLGCHPLHRQSALQAVWGSWSGPGQSNEGIGKGEGGVCEGLDVGRNAHIQLIPPQFLRQSHLHWATAEKCTWEKA